MRKEAPELDCDIEAMVAKIGAPPVAPMSVVRQQLERAKDQSQPGFLPRLRGAISFKAGH